MTDRNGTQTSTVSPQVPPQPENEPEKQQRLYRPDADTGKVYETIERSLGEIVFEAAHQAAMFVGAARIYHGDTQLVRYGHLVDAAECLEIALTHLGLLRSSVAFRLSVGDDYSAGDGQNIGSDPL